MPPHSPTLFRRVSTALCLCGVLLLCGPARTQDRPLPPGAAAALRASQGEAQTQRIVVAGDTLNISVEEQPDLNSTYGVAGDGTISLGQFGRVSVGERTLEGARQAVVDYLEGKYFKKATVSLSISNFVEGSVYVTGLGGRGTTEIPFKGDQLLTVFEAITKAGGLGPRANGRKVKILRWKPGGGMDREIVTVDVQHMLETLDLSRDEYLRPRDTVMIPALDGDEEAQEVLYLGEVASPGYHPWNSRLNMLRMVASHGYTSEAQLDSARILRPTKSGEYSSINVDIALLLSGDMSQNIPILPGDMIYIPRIGMNRAGQVHFYGEVARKGPYPLPVRGDKMLSLALMEVGVSPYAKTKEVQVTRRDPATGKKQTLNFNVEQIYKTGNIEDDLPLLDGDIIMVGEKIFSL